MNMDKFLEQVKDLLQAAFPEAEVSLKNVTKNNGLILHGVCIREDERTISPTIYLDSFYEELDDVYDGKIEYVVKKVIDLYEDKKDIQISTGFFTDYEQVKHMLGIKLINKDKNEELLKNSPHYVYGDLAAVFIVCIPQFEDGTRGTILIRNENLKFWEDVDKARLLKDALDCMRKTPPVIKTIADALRGFMGESFEDMPDSDDMLKMYVLTNKDSNYGASQILLHESLDEIAERLGESRMYVIPSSVHEVLVIPVRGECIDIANMIREVNDTVVSREDILSYNLYLYDAEDKMIRIASTGTPCTLRAAA